jgi:hypothetical protein
MRDLSLRLLLVMTLSLTSQGEMSSSRLVSPEDLSDRKLLLLFMLLPLVVVVKWLLGSLLLVVSWLLMVLFLTTELDLARLEAVNIILHIFCH